MSNIITRETHTLDATDQSNGRIASEVAQLLMGKHKPSYQAHTDCGDMVIVKNASHMRITGKKAEQKVYHRNTGFPSGIRTEKLKDLMDGNASKVLRMSVRGMLPTNKLRQHMLKRLTIEE